MVRVVAVLVLVVGLAGCKQRVCAPGQQLVCPCAGGTQSVQVCSDDGARLGPCACNNRPVAAVAPAPTSSPTTAPSPAAPIAAGVAVATIDFKNAELPLDATQEPLSFRKGEARRQESGYEIRSVVRGDLDGDGEDEAVVLIRRVCNNKKTCGNSGGLDVVVLKAVGDKLSYLAGESFRRRGSPVPEHLSVASGLLTIVGRAHAPNDARCCPSLNHKSTYRLKDAKLVRVSHSNSPAADKPGPDAKLPLGWPTDIPTVPAGTIKNTYPASGGTMWEVRTNVPPAVVLEVYARAMPGRGWRTLSSSPAPSGGMLTFDKPPGRALSVSATRGASGTTLVMIIAKGG